MQNYLAIGDRLGRICVHKAVQSKSGASYEPFAVFQAHTTDFDYLKSVDIEAKINMIRFCPDVRHSLFILNANGRYIRRISLAECALNADKAIKLWRVTDLPEYQMAPSNHAQISSIGSERTSRLKNIPRALGCTMKHNYTNAHLYHINSSVHNSAIMLVNFRFSVSVTSDFETFISADDLRINLWNFEHPMESFQILDIKPERMDDLNEVITSAVFHPTKCNLFAYCTSRGSVRLMVCRSKRVHGTRLFSLALICRISTSNRLYQPRQ
jgi:serine/threonine-protein phosphatase 2A regulatory subunit B